MAQAGAKLFPLLHLDGERGIEMGDYKSFATPDPNPVPGPHLTQPPMRPPKRDLEDVFVSTADWETAESPNHKAPIEESRSIVIENPRSAGPQRSPPPVDRYTKTAFREQTRSSSPPVTGKPGLARDELGLLGLNWRLLHGLAEIYRGGPLEAIHESRAALRDLKIGLDMGSTEVQCLLTCVLIWD